MSGSKRFKSSCVNELYKSAYMSKFQWTDHLEEPLGNYLELFSKAYNCPVTVSMGSLFPLTSTMCGSNTTIVARGDTFIMPMNLYSMVVSAPGGGKSVAFKHLIQGPCDTIQAEKAISIQIESYTVAGLQRHQQDNKGYALLTSDEGHRILASINVKQQKSEGERALLSKLWGGTGDKTVLLEKDRGFQKTAFSMCILVQPGPLITELACMGIDDGFLDRFIFSG